MSIRSLFTVAGTAVILLGCDMGNSQDLKIADYNDSLSYSYGVQIAESIRLSNKEELDVDLLTLAIKEALDDKSQMSLEQCQSIIQGEQVRAMEAKNAEVIEAGTAFLAENGSKEGVTTTASGLQIRTIVEGSGKSPKASDRVTVHYTGKLIDGTVFDSSLERGEPTTFGLNQVIRGWTEGLQLMKVGEKAEIVIPSELGYGARGAGGAIPPYATLVFEVELISIEK